MTSTELTRQWLDLSQFKMNPYILELLSGRTEQKLGRLEIALQSGSSEQYIFQEPILKSRFAKLIGQMFLTKPLYKALSIYASRVDNRLLHPFDRIYDEGGIRIGQFLATLEQHASDLLSVWRE